MWVLICAYLDKLIGTSKIKQGAIMSHPMTHNPITQHKEIDDVNIEKFIPLITPKLPKKRAATVGVGLSYRSKWTKNHSKYFRWY